MSLERAAHAVAASTPARLLAAAAELHTLAQSARVAAVGAGLAKARATAAHEKAAAEVRRLGQAEWERLCGIRCMGICMTGDHAGQRCLVTAVMKGAHVRPLRNGARHCSYHAYQDEEDTAAQEQQQERARLNGMRCRGVCMTGDRTQTPPRLVGQRCVVTAAMTIPHAQPLFQGELYCAHHADQAACDAGELEQQVLLARCRCCALCCDGRQCFVTAATDGAHADPLRNGEPFSACSTKMHCVPALWRTDSHEYAVQIRMLND